MHNKQMYILEPNLALDLPLHAMDGSGFVSRDAHGHLCTVNGPSWTLRGRKFDGVDDFLSVPHQSCLESESMAWMFWFRHSYASFPLNDEKGLLMKALTTGGIRSISITLGSDGALQFFVGNAAGTATAYNFTTTTAYTDNNFHFVALIKTFHPGGDNFKSIVDGNLLDSADSSEHGYQSTNPLEFGRCSSGSLSTRYLNGICGEIIVENRALTLPEVEKVRLATKWRYQ